MALKQSCYVCGEKNFVQRHHIIPRAKGGSDDSANIIKLCPTCHSATHHGIYSEEELFRLKEMRENPNIKPPKARTQIAELPLEVIYTNLTFQELSAIQAQRQCSPVDRLGLK